MEGQVFLSEFVGEMRTAQVFKDRDTGKFIVFGYEYNTIILKEYFNQEHEADDFADDWVLIPE